MKFSGFVLIIKSKYTIKEEGENIAFEEQYGEIIKVSHVSI